LGERDIKQQSVDSFLIKNLRTLLPSKQKNKKMKRFFFPRTWGFLTAEASMFKLREKFFYKRRSLLHIATVE
jgi:hypothetical protein